jgi:protein involved in polysaccharide export with SLBB domain
LTPDEIARRLTTEIKVIQNPRPIVSVRDYASHAVLITGAVDSPGRKMLRREAVPLFTLMAEALARSDAATAIVLRNGKEIILSLAKSQDLSTLIVAGDSIRVLATAKQFVYIGGDIVSTGERELRDGMTLTQVLLASGGVRRDSQNKARVTRRDSSGLLKSEEYNLNTIEAGKAPDPLLQPGDRIEVKRSM